MPEIDDKKITKRSVIIAGHATSISLEEAFWRELKAIAAAQGRSVGMLIAEVDAGRSGNLSSALRLYVLQWLKKAKGN